MGTLNIKVDGEYFFYQVAPEAEFNLDPLDAKSASRLMEYIHQKHALPQQLRKRVQYDIFLRESVLGMLYGCCMSCMICFCLPVCSPDQQAWDMDVDTNKLRLHIVEQLATVMPPGTWRIIESIGVGTPWKEGRTLFKLHILDPTRRDA